MRKKMEINPKTPIRLKEFLNESGLKQKELAEIIYCTQQHISEVMRSNRALSRASAEEIAKHYSIRVEYLLGEDDYKTESEKKEAEQNIYTNCLQHFISFANELGYSFIVGEKCEIKKDGKKYCSCSKEKLEVIIHSLIIHTEQHINDFVRFERTK